MYNRQASINDLNKYTVSVRTDRSIGAGIIVTDSGLILTCYHVIGDARDRTLFQDIEVYLPMAKKTIAAQVIEEYCRSEQDIAFLQIKDEFVKMREYVAVAPLDINVLYGHDFASIGFRKAQQFQKLSTFGRIEITTDLNNNSYGQLIQLYSDQIEEGMSGGAVLDLETNRVVGIVSLHHPAKGSNVDTKLNFAIPVSSVLESSKAASILREKNPGLKAGLLDRVTMTGDVKLIKNKKDIEEYYNVLQNRIIRVRDSTKEDIKKWIQDWDWQNGIGKPILLITGDPGMGKSWLANNVVSELMDEGYIIMKITGANIQKTLFRESSTIEGSEYQSKSVFILDDRFISIGDVDAPVSTDDVYDILKSMTDIEERFLGPVLLSVREETWTYITGGTTKKRRFDEYSIDKLVQRIELNPLNYQEAKKMVESFYSIVDQKNPPYKNLIVDDFVKNTIIERSKGNSVIIRLFFDYMDFKSKGNNYTLSVSDTEEIMSSAKYYCLKQVFNFYLNNLDQEEEEKVVYVLALLYFICKRGTISIGYLKCIAREGKNSIPVEVMKLIDLLNYKRALPLFNIDDCGIISAFHNSANEAIINIVEKPGKLRKTLEDLSNKDQNQQHGFNIWATLLNKISKISDINFNIGIKEKSESQFIGRFNESIKDYAAFYLRKWNYEIENDDWISSESAYFLLSLLVDILLKVQRKEFEVIFRDYWDEFGELLIKNKFEYGKLQGNIEKQLFLSFLNLGLLDEPEKEVKDYYKKLLDSSNDEIKYSMWEIAPHLLEKGVLNEEDLQNVKHGFMSLLGSNDKSMKIGLLRVLPGIVKTRLLKPEELSEVVSRYWHAQDESEKAFALGFLSIMIVSDRYFQYEGLMILTKFVIQLIESPKINDLMTGWNYLGLVLNQTSQTVTGFRGDSNDGLDQQEVNILKLIILDIVDTLFRILINTNLSKEMNILVPLKFLTFFSKSTVLDFDPISEDLSKCIIKGVFSDSENIQRFFIILLRYSVFKEISSPELTKTDEQEIEDILKEIKDDLSKPSVDSRTVLTLVAQIKDEITTMKLLTQLKQDFFKMLKNPSTDPMLVGPIISILIDLDQEKMVEVDQVQQIISEILLNPNRTVTTIAILSTLFDIIRRHKYEIKTSELTQINQLQEKFKDMLFDMIKTSDNNTRVLAMNYLSNSYRDANDPKDIMKIKSMTLDILDIAQNANYNIKLSAALLLSTLLDNKEYLFHMESEDIRDLEKKLIEMSFDVLKSPDIYIRASAFQILASISLEIKDGEVLFDDQEANEFIRRLVDEFISLVTEGEINIQPLLMGLTNSSLLKEILEQDDSQGKRLREEFINLQKSPHKQLRDLAKTCLDKLEIRSSEDHY